MKRISFFDVTIPEALSKEEELSYFKRLRNGDLSVREELINHNIRLVIHIVRKKFFNSSLDLEELVSEGALALVKAVDTFDYDRNPNFSTYACMKIEYSLLDHLKKSSSNEVSLDENMRTNKSIQDDNLTYGETVLDDSIDIENDYIEDSVSDFIIRLVDEIKYDMERDIVKKTFGFGCKRLSQMELAEIHNVTQSTISRIIFKNVRTIAYKLENMGLIHLNSKDRTRLNLDDTSDILTNLKHMDTSYEVKEGVTKKIGRKIKPFYDYFEGYTHEEVDEAISYLKDDDLKILHIKYGKKLDNPYSLIDGNSRESVAVYNQIVPRVSKILESLRKQKENNTNETICVYGKYKTLFEVLSDYSKEEIIKAVGMLKPEDERIIYLMYGDNLDARNPSLELTKHEKSRAHSSIKRILIQILEYNRSPELFRVQNGVGYQRKIKTVYEVLKDYTRDEINYALALLPEDMKYLLFLRYGYDLDIPYTSDEYTLEDSLKINRTVFPKMRRIMNRIRKENVETTTEDASKKEDNKIVGRKLKTIYEIFNEYTPEEINYVITLLPEDLKQLMYLRYGDDLNNPVTSEEFNSKNYKRFYSTLIPKIRKLLVSKREGKALIVSYEKRIRSNKTIFELFNRYTEEEIMSAVEELDEEDKRIVYLKYGTNLKSTVKDERLSSKESKEFYSNIRHKISSRLVRNRKAEERNITSNSVMVYNDRENELMNFVSKDDYIKLVSFLKKMNMKEMFDVVNPQDLIITSLRFGYVEDKYYSIEAISKFFSMSEVEVLEAIKRTLEQFKNINGKNDSEMKLTHKESDDK